MATPILHCQTDLGQLPQEKVLVQQKVPQKVLQALGSLKGAGCHEMDQVATHVNQPSHRCHQRQGHQNRMHHQLEGPAKLDMKNPRLFWDSILYALYKYTEDFHSFILISHVQTWGTHQCSA